MRVATNTQFNDFLYNMGVSGTKMQKTMNQLASLKEVSQSSENPLLVSKIMNLNVALDKNKTYNTEIKDSISWTDTQDGVLDTISNNMLRIRTLIQSSANGTSDAGELKANANEIRETIQSIVDALNTNYDGRYMFSGQKTDTPPFKFENDELTYQGSDGNLTRQLADGVSVDLITNGKEFMMGEKDILDAGGNPTGAKEHELTFYFRELLGTLDETMKAMEDIKTMAETDPNYADTLNKIKDGQEKLAGDDLKNIDVFSENFSNVRTKIGAISNRLKAAEERNNTEKLSLKETLSERQDVDVAEKFMQYQNEYLAYQSTMAMGTKIMQTSILDYVR